MPVNFNTRDILQVILIFNQKFPGMLNKYSSCASVVLSAISIYSFYPVHIVIIYFWSYLTNGNVAQKYLATCFG